jgi:hypothetical protein
MNAHLIVAGSAKHFRNRKIVLTLDEDAGELPTEREIPLADI